MADQLGERWDRFGDLVAASRTGHFHRLADLVGRALPRPALSARVLEAGLVGAVAGTVNVDDRLGVITGEGDEQLAP